MVFRSQILALLQALGDRLSFRSLQEQVMIEQSGGVELEVLAEVHLFLDSLAQVRERQALVHFVHVLLVSRELSRSRIRGPVLGAQLLPIG